MSSWSFARAAREAPHDVALVIDGRSWTFGDLDRQVAAAARRVSSLPCLVGTVEPDLEGLVALWAALEAEVPFVPIHPRLPELERGARASRAFATPLPAGAAAVMFTSGTNGSPRGVILSRDNILAAAAASAANLGWRSDDRWLLCVPLAHVSGRTIPVRCLLAQRPVIALPRFEPAAFLDAVTRHRATLASVVPAMLAQLLAADEGNVLARMRAILVGGDATPAALLQAARERGVPVLVTYGLTETCGQVATQAPGQPPDAAGGCGRTLTGIEVLVDRGGGIYVRGPTVSTGAIGEMPRAPTEWLSTGDIGRFDDRGNLHIAGRAVDVIVTGGENVSPVRVEGVLSRAPGVRAALVCGTPSRTWGEIVCAALVADPTAAARPTDDDVLAFAAQELATFERPRRIVWVDELPTTETGKLSRAKARGLFVERDGADWNEPGVPPAGPGDRD